MKIRAKWMPEMYRRARAAVRHGGAIIGRVDTGHRSSAANELPERLSIGTLFQQPDQMACNAAALACVLLVLASGFGVRSRST